MKKILITGENSYIGTSFENWMKQYSDDYIVDTISVRGDEWENFDFSVYDTVFHVAGIAHADVSKVTEEQKKLYYRINRDLAVAVAKKYRDCLKDGTGQFIYMSSIIIYGEETSIRKKRIITPNTTPKPSNFYGDSKWQAEQELRKLETENYKIAIVRPPMIYGPDSKGNYKQLEKLADKLLIFPDVKNERSVLFINNLCLFIKQLIDNELDGVFFPQDESYTRTSYMVKNIAKEKGKKIYLFSFMNWAVYLLGFFPGKIGKLTNKAFGNLTYSKVIT